MPRSRVPAVLAVVLTLAGAASAWLSTGADAATLSPWSSPTSPPSSSQTPTPLDTITIDPAVVTDVADGVVLSVTAVSTTPLTALTVQLTGGENTLDPAMTSPGPTPVSDGYQSTWSSETIPAGIPETGGLPLGTYTYTVGATDQGAGITTGTTTGPFPFLQMATITPNPVNDVVSYSNQQPTASGHVTISGPGITTSAAYTGPLVLDDSAGGDKPLTLGEDGGYSYRFTQPEPGETFSIEVPGSATVAAASSSQVAFSVRTDPVAMTASLSAKSVSYGGKATVGGTVTYKPGAAFVPLQGLTVQVFYNQVGSYPVATAVTNAEGHFTAALPRVAQSVHWVVRAAGTYLTTATVTLPMKVSLPTVISGFQVSLSQLWQLSFRGCLVLPAGVPGYVPSLSGLTIQYAAGPNGPWHTLGTVPGRGSLLCGNGGRAFSGTLTARLNYAYYRAAYPGGTNGSGTGYLASASGKVLAWKYADRITAFTLSSRTVPKNGHLTIAGQLQYFAGKWRAYAGQPVYIILRPQGSSKWYYIVYATTNSAGRFSATFSDPVSATWSAEFFGNSGHLATLAPMIFARVT